MEKVITAWIPVGLPGSGKTEWYARNKEKEGLGHYVDADEFMMNTEYNKSVSKLERLVEHIKSLDKTVVYIDGLFLTTDTQEYFRKHFRVEFIYFNATKEDCIYNDEQRDRDLKAKGTINNARIEKPGSFTKEVKVQRYDFINEVIIDLKLGRAYQSDTWSLGGTWRNYNDDGGDINPGEPLSINEFEGTQIILRALLSKEPTVEQIKSYQHLVYEDEYDEGDYYGGSEGWAYWEVDTRTLIEEFYKKEEGIYIFDLKFIRKAHPDLII